MKETTTTIPASPDHSAGASEIGRSLERPLPASALSGKKILLLGASSGLGLATAKAAAEGTKISIVSGNRQRIDQALKQLPAGSEGHAVDLSKEEKIKNFFHTIGSFDHLVYSAGENLSLHLVSDTDIDEARQFLDIRFWGAFAAVKYGAPHINAGGSISLTSGSDKNQSLE